MAVLSWLAGVASPSSFSAMVELDSGSTARMVVASDQSLSDAIPGPEVAVDGGLATVYSPTLAPNTRYWAGVEVDGNLQDFTAKVLTDPLPGARTNLIIRAASCAGQNTPTPGTLGDELAPARVSDSPFFSQFAQAGGEWVNRQVHLGDWTYYDLGSGNHGIVGGSSLANLRKMFSDFLRQPNQKTFWSSAASVLLNDDHELRNDHDASDDGLPRLRQVFSERVPHTELLVPGTLYREEMLGRILCIYLDSRSARSPNNAADGPSKTMLGVPQRDRFESTIRAAGEDPNVDYVLVFSPSVWWQPDRLDGWDSFRWEQNYISSFIAQSGLTERLDIICGDVHALGIDSGGNSPGGIRTATFAAIDSSGGSSLNHNDLGPTSPGRGRWGTISIQYTATELRVELVAWIGGVQFRSHPRTVQIGNTPEPPPPDPELPTDTVATASSIVKWLCADLKTGDVLEWLPFNSGSISRMLCNYTSDTITIPMPLHGVASGFGRTVEPGRTALVCLVNEKPAWSGIVMKTIDGHEAKLDAGCISMEGYLWRHYVGDHIFNNADEAAIVGGLLSDVMDNGIRLILDCPPTGIRRSRTYNNTDDAVVGERLQELSEVIGGPEWTIDTEWDVPGQRVVWVFRLRRRIGHAEPRVTLSTDGPAAARWSRTHDFAEGSGATHVIAYSTGGEGDDRPESAPHIDTVAEANGMPRYEFRFSPSSSITTQSVLDDHAAAELQLQRNGIESVEVTVRRNAEPGRWSVDWDMGDSIRYRLLGPRVPDGLIGTARCVGWKMDTTSEDIVPTLLFER